MELVVVIAHLFRRFFTESKRKLGYGSLGNRRGPLIKKILFGLLAGLLSGNCALARERPNILLLMAEDMSPRVGAFGDSIAVTPSLDALAAEGVRYPNTFTTAGVCAPSRASHILGMHQISTGGQHMRTMSAPDGGYFAVPPAAVKAYPELLRATGYYLYGSQAGLPVQRSPFG